MAIARERSRWLLLIHQIPKDPAYLRVKTGRRLARIGALAIKNSVYVLPNTPSTLEDFQWVRSEITHAGGEATLVQAEFVEGLSDDAIEARFREAREADYAPLIRETRELLASTTGWPKAPPSDDEREAVRAGLARVEQRVAEITTTDFFGASGRELVAGLVHELKNRVTPPTPLTAVARRDVPRGAVWVTRQGIHVDRIASAWLIRRFIDADAAFKFVDARGYAPADGELRFDMADAEYSHEGDACTFETLIDRFELTDSGLRAIAELVHDVDLKDDRFARPETPGFAACIGGVCRGWRADEDRLSQGSVILGAMYSHFSARRAQP